MRQRLASLACMAVLVAAAFLIGALLTVGLYNLGELILH